MLQHFHPCDLPNLLWALVSIDPNLPFLRELGYLVVERTNDFQIEDLAAISLSFQRANLFEDKTLQEGLSAALCNREKLNRATAQDLAMICTAYAQAEIADQDVFYATVEDIIPYGT